MVDILVVLHGTTFGNFIFDARKSVNMHVSAGAGMAMKKLRRIHLGSYFVRKTECHVAWHILADALALLGGSH